MEERKRLFKANTAFADGLYFIPYFRLENGVLKTSVESIEQIKNEDYHWIYKIVKNTTVYFDNELQEYYIIKRDGNDSR